MGVLANMFGTGKSLPAAVESDSEWDRQQAREAALNQEMNELGKRIRHIQSTVLDPLNVQKQELAGIKAKRLQAGAAAFIDGKQQDLKAIDADIEQREAVIASLGKEVDAANVAMAQLGERMREKEQEVAMLAQNGLRLKVRHLESRLREFAPEFVAALETYKGAVVEMAALAMARDALGPKVAGNTPIGSNGMAEVQVAVPSLPAYDAIRNSSVSLYKEATARMRVILAEIGERV